MGNSFIIQQQFERLRQLLLHDTDDLSWSNYNNVDEILFKLDVLENDIISMKNDATDRLSFLVAPTGSLQEISLSNGWGYEFNDIAEKMKVAMGICIK